MRTDYKIPKTCLILLLYCSIVLRIFSLWNSETMQPKYGLCKVFMCRAFTFWNQETGKDKPLAKDLKHKQLKLEALVLTNRGDIMLQIILID